MALYILDTDIITLLQAGNSALALRISSIEESNLFTTSITIREQLRGRLAAMNRATEGPALVYAHEKFLTTFRYLHQIQILPFDDAALAQLQQLRAQNIRVGTQDLRIAAIVLSIGGTLVTRNYRDFQKIPNLALDNWIDS